MEWKTTSLIRSWQNLSSVTEGWQQTVSSVGEGWQGTEGLQGTVSYVTGGWEGTANSVSSVVEGLVSQGEEEWGEWCQPRQNHMFTGTQEDKVDLTAKQRRL